MVAYRITTIGYSAYTNSQLEVTMRCSIPVDFESELDQLIDCCADLINDPSEHERQARDAIFGVEEAERAYQVELVREYDFEEQAEVQPVQN
jgi:hypothetical protein